MSSSDDEAKKPDIDLMNRSSIEKHAILTEVSPDEEEVRLKLRLPMNPDRPSNDLLDSRPPCDGSLPRHRYDSGMLTSDRDLLQIGVRSVEYGVDASGRLWGSSGDESNMLSSDDEFDETSYCESSDDEFDETSYREKLIDGIVYFSEHAERAMDIVDRLCELPGGRNTWRYREGFKLVIECMEKELTCLLILLKMDSNKDSSEMSNDRTVAGDTSSVRECDGYSDVTEEEEDGEEHTLDVLSFELQQLEADAARVQQMQRSYGQQQLEVLEQLQQLYTRDSDRYDQILFEQQQKNLQLSQLLKQEEEEAANSCRQYNSKQNQLNSGSMVQLIASKTPADASAALTTSLLSQNTDESWSTSLIGVRNFRSDHSEIAVVNNECNIDKRSTTSVENARVKIQKLQALQSEFMELCDFVNAHRDAGMDESVDSAEQLDNDVSEEFDIGMEDGHKEKLSYLPDGSADRKVRMIRESCQFALDHFEVRAERKEQYPDVRMHQKVYKPGIWVYYDTSRRYEGRSPKLKEMYTGSFMVIKEVGPVECGNTTEPPQ